MTTLLLIWIVASFLFSAGVGRAATLGGPA